MNAPAPVPAVAPVPPAAWRALVAEGGLVPDGPARSLITMATALVAAFVLLAVALGVTPWQQTAPAKGTVIAFNPVDRAQRIDATIKGRVQRWYVVEGQEVKAGDPICQIVDLDPLYLRRSETKLRSAKAGLTASEGTVTAAEAKLAAWIQAKPKAIRAANLEIEMAEQKLRAVQQKLRAAKTGERVSRLDVRRRRKLLAEGLESRRGRDLAELAATKGSAKVQERRADVASARAYIIAKKASALKVEAELIAKVAGAQADVRKAEASRAKAQAQVAVYEVDLARQQQGLVLAPRGGVIVRLAGTQEGGVVKAGERLGTLLPTSGPRAVELWVAGRDAPLIRPGRLARVQLEGWPAVQLSGWPALATGTFQARVSFVAPVADAKGRFRVLLRPDPEGDAWPPVLRLGQGLRARGWVFLDRVSLAYELWRLFNGFPAQAPKDMISGASSSPGGGKKTGKKSGKKGAAG